MSGPQYRVEPAPRVSGTITVPGDKSISHRSLMLSGIAQGRSRISGFLESEDCLSTLRAMQALGVNVERGGPGSVTVDGVGLHGLKAAAAALDLGNAGTAIRLFTGLLSAQAFDSILVGDSSLMRRPMERVAEPLRKMGADITTHAGRPPLEIRGRKLQAIHYDLPVASAQVKSAILLAGLYAQGTTSVSEPGITRDHTERMLQSFGVEVQTQERRAQLTGPAQLKAVELTVPGDFSSAAFFIVAGCLAAEGVLTLRNVGINPTRIGLLDILRRMGAEIRVVNQRSCGAEPVADLEIERRALRGIDVPKEAVPLAIDEFPALFVAAACAEGVTRVTGAAELRVKESDRIAVMAQGLQVLGIETEVLSDGLVIAGRKTAQEGGEFGGGRVDSHGDHRIAMSFAIASLRARAPIEILDVANVATSFPGFVDTARQLGLRIEQRTA